MGVLLFCQEGAKRPQKHSVWSSRCTHSELVGGKWMRTARARSSDCSHTYIHKWSNVPSIVRSVWGACLRGLVRGMPLDGFALNHERAEECPAPACTSPSAPARKLAIHGCISCIRVHTRQWIAHKIFVETTTPPGPRMFTTSVRLASKR